MNVKDLIPPVILKLFYKLSGHGDITWNGAYSTWNDAMNHSRGYDEPAIFEKIKIAALKVKKGEALFERDSVLFYKNEYNWPLLSILFKASAEHANRLRIIDFGGSLGSTYFQHITLLEHLVELKWNIIEQKQLVEFGRENMENEQLKFYHSLEECLTINSCEVLLSSGTFQYLKDPFSLIKKIVDLDFKYIICDRINVINQSEDTIMVQAMKRNVYDASYPVWIFNYYKFISLFQPNYKLISEFDTCDFYDLMINKEEVKWKGLIFKLNNQDNS